jgi:serine/threonine-protein kinase HipA
VNKPTVHVFAAGRTSGQMFRSEREQHAFLFGYDKAATKHEAVSVTMPVRAEQYDSMAGLLPIFEMNLPEGALKERLTLQFAKSIPEFDDLDLLSIVGASQIGRLRHSLSPALTEAVPTQDLGEILTYQGSEDLFAYLLERFARYSGVSGVQPKVLVRDAATPLSKLAHHGATHIVKSFEASEYPELAANEYLCTNAAAAAGIHTARVELSENRRFLIADRFDLTKHGAYSGIEDMCVLNGMRAHGRYDGSYELIAKRLGQFVSREHIKDMREQYARRVAFACAIENGDAHMKNFSVIYEDPEGAVRLAPSYDTLSTTPYMPNDTLALTLEESKTFPDRQRLMRFVRKVTGKTEAAANRLLEEVAHGSSTAIGAVKRYAKLHGDAEEFRRRMTAAIERGLNRLSSGASVSVPHFSATGPSS